MTMTIVMAMAMTAMLYKSIDRVYLASMRSLYRVAWTLEAGCRMLDAGQWGCFYTYTYTYTWRLLLPSSRYRLVSKPTTKGSETFFTRLSF